MLIGSHIGRGLLSARCIANASSMPMEKAIARHFTLLLSSSDFSNYKRIE